MKKHRRPFREADEKDLEWYMENWNEICEICKSKLMVNSYRRGSLKWKSALYCACFNKSCRNHYLVICFYQ